jgi:hypothetical protein
LLFPLASFNFFLWSPYHLQPLSYPPPSSCLPSHPSFGLFNHSITQLCPRKNNASTILLPFCFFQIYFFSNPALHPALVQWHFYPYCNPSPWYTPYPAWVPKYRYEWPRKPGQLRPYIRIHKIKIS